MSERASVAVTVQGRVQGVFFRASAQKTAIELGLTGWVKNLPDGGVELYAEGTKAHLAQLVQWCHRGPPAAEVESVRAHWGNGRGEFESFSVVG